MVANRLSENPDVHILVIEAGADYMEDPRTKIPAFCAALKDSG